MRLPTVRIQQDATGNIWIDDGRRRQGPWPLDKALRLVRNVLAQIAREHQQWRQRFADVSAALERWRVGSSDNVVTAAEIEAAVDTWPRRSTVSETAAQSASDVAEQIRDSGHETPTATDLVRYRSALQRAETAVLQALLQQQQAWRNALATLERMQRRAAPGTAVQGLSEWHKLRAQGYYFEMQSPGVWTVIKPGGHVRYRITLNPPSCTCPWGQQVAEWGLDLSVHSCKHYRAVRELDAALLGAPQPIMSPEAEEAEAFALV